MKKCMLVVVIAFTSVGFAMASPVTSLETASKESYYQLEKTQTKKTIGKKHHSKKKGTKKATAKKTK